VGAWVEITESQRRASEGLEAFILLEFGGGEVPGGIVFGSDVQPI